MDPHKRVKVAVTLVFFFLGLATAGYSVITGYSVLDAFYKTVITISTVGYGEIQQLCGAGRLFTIDSHLPAMSGMVISHKIRELPYGKKVKIFLFSKGQEDGLYKQARTAGVDKVVGKSPDAGEIVAMVLEKYCVNFA